MPTITAEQLKHHKSYFAALEKDREPWRALWRELADNYLPQRYRWLLTEQEYTAKRARRQFIINNTGTQAARTLGAGMMNGITSPARPWFQLRDQKFKMEQHRELSVWLEEVERILLTIMAESNFYNSMAVMYLDMAVFGTAVNLIYEDFDNVIRCYNPPLGEFYIANDSQLMARILGRKFNMKIHQYIERWPNREYWSDRVKTAVTTGGGALNQDVEICHFIAPNRENIVPAKFRYYEIYYESKRSVESAGGIVLSKTGFNELPGIIARWETSGIDPYGIGPGMDALGDVMELQHLHRNKAELLEKQNKPPMGFDAVLANKPVAMMPGGRTFIPGFAAGSRMAEPLYQVQPNFNEIAQDKNGIEERIRNTFFNFLFTGITNLPTVRSATEVDAREGEKLILLGGVLERFESEALDPAINRIYSVAERAGLIPPPPQGYEKLDLEIQYVSILSVAQRAVGTAPTERWLQLSGSLAAVRPDILDLTNFDAMLTNYARDIGIRENDLNDPKVVMQQRAQRQAAEQGQQAMAAAPPLAQAAQTLSETDVGGGGNALEHLLAGGGG